MNRIRVGDVAPDLEFLAKLFLYSVQLFLVNKVIYIAAAKEEQDFANRLANCMELCTLL